MGYASSVLVSGEEILYEGHFHWLDKIVAGMMCFVGASVLLLMHAREPVSTVISFVVLLIGLARAIGMWSTEMVITDRRLIYKRGWIARKTEELRFTRLEEVNLRQSVLGRILGYGKVKVQGTGGGDIILPAIGSPMRFKNRLDEARDRADPV